MGRSPDQPIGPTEWSPSRFLLPTDYCLLTTLLPSPRPSVCLSNSLTPRPLTADPSPHFGGVTFPLGHVGHVTRGGEQVRNCLFAHRLRQTRRVTWPTWPNFPVFGPEAKKPERFRTRGLPSYRPGKRSDAWIKIKPRQDSRLIAASDRGA
jgi:hypothetical protein